jgi:hypothetical protein
LSDEPRCVADEVLLAQSEAGSIPNARKLTLLRMQEAGIPELQSRMSFDHVTELPHRSVPYSVLITPEIAFKVRSGALEDPCFGQEQLATAVWIE